MPLLRIVIFMSTEHLLISCSRQWNLKFIQTWEYLLRNTEYLIASCIFVEIIHSPIRPYEIDDAITRPVSTIPLVLTFFLLTENFLEWVLCSIKADWPVPQVPDFDSELDTISHTTQLSPSNHKLRSVYMNYSPFSPSLLFWPHPLNTFLSWRSCHPNRFSSDPLLKECFNLFFWAP